jgi:hypothetical protein
MRRSSRALKEIVDIKFTGRAIIIILISLFLLMPAIANEIKHPKQSILETIHRIFFSLLFFLYQSFFHKTKKLIYIYY